MGHGVDKLHECQPKQTQFRSILRVLKMLDPVRHLYRMLIRLYSELVAHETSANEEVLSSLKSGEVVGFAD